MKNIKRKSIAAIGFTALSALALGIGVSVADAKKEGGTGFMGSYNLTAFAESSSKVAVKQITIKDKSVDITSTATFKSTKDNGTYTLCLTVIDLADFEENFTTPLQIGHKIDEGKYYNSKAEGLSELVYSSLTFSDGTKLSVTELYLSTAFAKPYFIVSEVSTSLVNGTVLDCIVAEKHNLEYVAGTPSTCLAAGNLAYYHCADDGCNKYFTDSLGLNEIADLDAWKTGEGAAPALGHNYDTENIKWTWEGYTGATATITCLNGDHPETVTANVALTTDTPATCAAEGQKVYTATIEFNGKTYTDTKTETLTKLEHSYGTPSRVEPTEDKEGSITETCSVCNYEKVTVIPAYISAPGTDGVSYAKNVWTFNKNANGDYNQQINISKEAVAKWIADGYSIVTLRIVHKDGEILGTQGVQTKWTVTLADCVDNGYSFIAYIAPRNEQGGYGNITGFLVSAEFTVAYNEAKPETYIMAEGTDGITYADGVWTVAKTAAYAADFYQDIVVRPETIAYWMEQGYAKMTFAVSAKSGENTVIMYDGGFAHTVTFTEAMKTEGYTFPHVFIAPRSSSGMTGFNVTIELVEPFDVSNMANYVTAADTDGVTYADNSWTFAKTATAIDGSADFYQDVVISSDLIAYWAELGHTNMSISISAKEGESFVLMGVANPTSVELTDEVKTNGYTLSHFFVAPRTAPGITGFVITIVLS